MRPPRLQIPDGIYHVTSRAARGLMLFPTDETRRIFLDIVGIAVGRAEWICHDYCVMGTHFHLLVQTPEPNLAVGMKRLNWLYSRTFNGLQGARGHLFEGRYTSELVQSREHFVAAIRYIALNPVEAGLCRSPVDWNWSGYRALAGLEEPRSFHDPARALLEIDDRPEVARTHVRWIVEGLAPVSAPR